MRRKRVGEILVEHGILTEKTVERMLRVSKERKKRIGVLLEELGLITDQELAAVLAAQYGCRVVGNFSGHSFGPELLSLIPVDVAMQNQIFPLKLDNNRLALAMADPTQPQIVKNMAANHGLTIVPFVATHKEIYEAICRNYLMKEPTHSQAETVLVVEEDKLARTMFCDLLSKQGYRVVSATDGLEAYKSVITEKPHVILTDLHIPKLDAYGLFDALHTVPELKQIPLILVAETMYPDDEARAFDRGFFDFIAKPVKEATLVTRVKRAFLFYERKYVYS